MNAEYEMTYSDWLIASRAWYSNRYRFRWIGLSSYLIARWLILLLAVGAIAVATTDLLIVGSDAGRAMIPLLGVGVVWLGLFGWTRYRSKKCFVENYGDKIRVELTDESMNVAQVDKISSEYQWKGMLAFLDDENFFLLYVKKRLFVPIPKRAIPTLDQATWSEFIRQRVGLSRP